MKTEMGYWLRKNWLIVITITSLTLNIIAAFFLYQDSKITVDNHEKNLIKAEPLDFETFKDQWGSAWLGLDVIDVTPDVAERASLYRVEGAYVKNVAPGSPAQKADFAPGDIILSFNGRKIRTPEQFQNDVAGSEVGSEVYMCVARDDHRITVYAVPEERPSFLPAVTKTFPLVGIKVNEIAFGSERAEKLQELGRPGGVLVEKVIPGSPAEEAELEEGDIIMSFESRPVRSLREFLSDPAGAQPGQTVSMCLMRADYRKTIYLTLEENPRYHEI